MAALATNGALLRGATNMQEPGLFLLKCPGCGAPLQVDKSVETFGCSYCGGSVQVHEKNGLVSLRLLKDAISGVQRGTDRTAAELAIRRLTDELAALDSQREAARASRDELDRRGQAKLKALANTNNGVALLIVAAVAGLVAHVTVTPVLWLIFGRLDRRAPLLQAAGAGFPSPYEEIHLIAILLAALIAFLYVQYTIQRGNSRAVAQEKSRHAQDVAVFDESIREIDSRMAGVRQRLATNRSMVE
jgi:hypothetical protein